MNLYIMALFVRYKRGSSFIAFAYFRFLEVTLKRRQLVAFVV